MAPKKQQSTTHRPDDTTKKGSKATKSSLSRQAPPSAAASSASRSASSSLSSVQVQTLEQGVTLLLNDPEIGEDKNFESLKVLHALASTIRGLGHSTPGSKDSAKLIDLVETAVNTLANGGTILPFATLNQWKNNLNLVQLSYDPFIHAVRFCAGNWITLGPQCFEVLYYDYQRKHHSSLTTTWQSAAEGLQSSYPEALCFAFDCWAARFVQVPTTPDEAAQSFWAMVQFDNAVGPVDQYREMNTFISRYLPLRASLNSVKVAYFPNDKISTYK